MNKWPDFMRKKKKRKQLPSYKEVKYQKPARKSGNWGIERYCRMLDSWGLWKWYPTEEIRDQAFDTLIKHKGYYSRVIIRKVER